VNRPLRTFTLTFVIAAGLTPLIGCSTSGSTTGTNAGTTVAPTGATTTAGVTVTNQWARQSPAMTQAGAAYMDLTSANGDKLMSASVPASVARTVELHETVMEGGSGSMGTSAGTVEPMSASEPPDGEPAAYAHGPTGSDETTGSGQSSGTTVPAGMSMKPVTFIDLPAGTTVQLKPGGYHIMLIDLVQPLKAGDQVQITLTFEEADPQQVTVPVREG
jgi:copper(I)-binding protein